jgi:hypothetical protein
MSACPACSRSRLHVGPPSRAHQRSITACRSCGAHYLTISDQSRIAVVPRTTMPAADYAAWAAMKSESTPQAWSATTATLRGMLAEVDRPVLYDIGAGDSFPV